MEDVLCNPNFGRSLNEKLERLEDEAAAAARTDVYDDVDDDEDADEPVTRADIPSISV